MIKNDADVHDTFGILVREQKRGYAMLEEGLQRQQSSSRVVSLGDLSSAFNAGTAIEYALKIPDVRHEQLLPLVLPTAERAAAATGQEGLRRMVDGAYALLNGAQFRAADFGLEQTDLGQTSENAAKSCARNLVRITRRGVVQDRSNLHIFYSFVLSGAREAIGLTAYEDGLSLEAAREAEFLRQQDDIISLSPLMASSRIQRDNGCR